jgi:hypothetical protein
MNGQVRAGQNLGLLATARGEWGQARKLLDASLAQAERQQMAEEAAVSRRNLAELELLQGHAEAAARHLGNASALFAGRGDRRGEIDVALLRVRADLLVGAADAAQRGLDALAPQLAEASAEQGAIASLLRASVARARGDDGGERAALAQAKARAAASGVVRWQLEAALYAGAAPDAALREAIDRLGNVALQLELAARSMRAALAANDAAGAAAEYRRTAARLATLGEYADASALHALGASALAQAGDAAGAARADALARATARPPPGPPGAATPIAEKADGH